VKKRERGWGRERGREGENNRERDARGSLKTL
jgi:hypothetical protein